MTAGLDQKDHQDEPKNRAARVLEFLSNGFVLLIVGAVITSFMVPRFQRAYEQKRQNAQLMQECLSQFLLYSNSIWQEYYSVFPLLHEAEIDLEKYNHHIREISDIKLQRYDAFARVQALAIVFRKQMNSEKSYIEEALYDYAVHINIISQSIDTWLRNLYCAPDKCRKNSFAPVSLDFDPYSSFQEIKAKVLQIENTDQKISELMVGQIKLVE